MLLRELSKKGEDRFWQIYVADRVVVENLEDGSSTHWGQSSFDDGMSVFEKKLRERERKFWRETRKSLSRRVFRHTQSTPGKFWIIWLSGNTVEVQYGKITKHNWSTGSGQTKPKMFPDPDKALEAYEKMIADKLVEGYEEIYKRKTEFSDLGEELAKKKQAAPKPVRKVKVVVAEENLAKVLQEQPVSQINTEITRRIDLNPADWFWATWRNLKPLPRPKPRAFDFEECLAIFATGQTSRDFEDWQNPSSPPMSSQEARFWFDATCDELSTRGPTAKETDQQRCERLAIKMRQRGVPSEATASEITERLKKCKLDPTDLSYLGSLLPVQELVELVLNKELYPSQPDSHSIFSFAHRFHYEIIPFLTLEEIAVLRKRVSRELDLTVQGTNDYKPFPLAFYLAGLLGCHKDLAAFIGTWPDNRYAAGSAARYHYPEILLFGLGDPKVVEAETRRLGLKLSDHTTIYTRGWLAHTELAALDIVLKSITQAWDKRNAESQFKILSLVKAPEVAPFMLELSQGGKVTKLANEWLQTEVGNAIAGLVSVAAGQGKLAEAAMKYLQEKKSEGHSDLIASALKKAPAEIAAKIKAQVLDRVERIYPEMTDKTTPKWFEMAAKQEAVKKPLPGAEFVKIGQLPAIVVDGKRLAPQQVATVLVSLQNSEFSASNEFLIELKKHVEPESLDAFAWSLFEQWLTEGAPPKQKWAMRAVGFLGSDALALKLTPLIRAWPGESQHPRAVLGLECLKQIGTDTALMQLNGIAVKLKFKGLQNKAREFMEAIAAEKGLTAAQLEDRIVPDCDLDERGSRVFDFGLRQFRFILGPDMKPMVKDPDGKVKPDLPKPGAKDDAVKAEEAVNAWKLLKKQIKEVASTQALRLEQAMVTGRRWPVADFQTLLVKHPLMSNLVRLVLWGGYDRKGLISSTFRVTEDQTFADAQDCECTLKGLDSVGIVHPLNLTEDQKSAWGEIFSDYEIVPPFPQLGRSTYAFDKSELNTNEIKRFSLLKIPCATLVFGLEKLGWARGQAQDNGQVNGHSKYFPSANLSAVVILDDGFTIGYREGWEDQKIADIYFVPGQYKVTWGRSRANDEVTIALKKLDPVIASEVLNDLTVLAAKGKES